MEVVCRKATEDDVEALYELINQYAERGIMLPRSRETLREQVKHFVVAEHGGTVIGCGSLCQLGSDLVEIRSLGVSENYKGRGIGKLLVSRLLEEARSRRFPKVMALTYEAAFFESVGFSIVPKHVFPEKVWRDCVSCHKQYCCDEIAVIKRLDT